MKAPEGVVVGRLTSGDGGCTHALVQGKAISLSDGISIISGWSDRSDIAIVCTSAPRARSWLVSHRPLGSTGVLVDTTGLPPRWRALFDGPLCQKCAAGIADARRPTRGSTR